MTQSPYMLAVDAGTTSVKVVLFDITGRELACHIGEYQLDRPAPDYVEVDPEVYWRAACEGMEDVLRAACIGSDDVAAVGVTSQGETLIVVDKDGRPLRKAIVWLDNRAKAETAQIAAKFSREEVYRTTGQQEIIPTWTAAKILWLSNHEPEVFAAAAKFLLVEDYLIYRLCGRFVTDHALVPSTIYYDLFGGRWWLEMLEFLGITEAQLPELNNSGEALGYVTAGVLGKTVVVTSAPIDQVAAAVGAGNIVPGMVTETTGSALAICATFDRPPGTAGMRTGIYRHAAPGHFLLMPWTPTGGMVLRWFRDELGAGEDYAELSSRAAKVAPGSDGLLLLPHLEGALCPDANSNAKGVFYGVSLAHTKGHFVRSILESVAFLLRHNLEALEQGGMIYHTIRSLGGGARDLLWLQIKADVLGKPVVILDGDEAACRGAAMLAAVGAGVFASLPQAIVQMVHIKRRFDPDPRTKEIYERAYATYKRLNQLLLPTFEGQGTSLNGELA